jgi:Flp pilus assembly protein TadG
MKKTDIVLAELEWFRAILRQGGKDAKYYEAQSDLLTKAIKLLEQEQLDQKTDRDTISRQAAIDAVKKNTFRLTFAEEQNCEGHVAWSANAVYSDVIEGALLELPFAENQPKMKTIKDCRNCKHGHFNDHWDTYFCYNPNLCEDWDKWEVDVTPKRTKRCEYERR